MRREIKIKEVQGQFHIDIEKRKNRTWKKSEKKRERDRNRYSGSRVLKLLKYNANKFIGQGRREQGQEEWDKVRFSPFVDLSQGI